MSEFTSLGKIDKNFFDSVIFPHLGATRPEVLYGPGIGLDNGIIKMASGQILAVTTDPISYIRELGPEDSAWISVHLLANDITTSALRPSFAILNLSLPPGLQAAQFERYWKAMHLELDRLGVAVIAGHTGHYGGNHTTIIGSGTLLAFGQERQYLTPAMARPGDAIIMTKGAMVATCGLLAKVFPTTIKRKFGSEFLMSSQSLLSNYPTTPDAMAAISVGIGSDGITAMHDTTEGGVYGALFELASAAGCGIVIDADKIPVPAEVTAICELFSLDPLRSLSEGALLICAQKNRANEVVAALAQRKIAGVVIGELKESDHGMWVLESGRRRPLEPGAQDPYWQAYQQAKERGWE